MKKLPFVVIAALCTMFMFCAVLYTSCRKSDSCLAITCYNGGICSDGQCHCTAGYEGTNCEAKTDACKDKKCLNGGVCQFGKCVCSIEYTGDSCEIRKCASVVCYNGGYCVGGKCYCAKGYEGADCATEVGAKFLGLWVNSEPCPNIGAASVLIVKTSAPDTVSVTYKSAAMNFSGKAWAQGNLLQAVGYMRMPNNGSVSIFGRIENGTLSFEWARADNNPFEFKCKAIYQHP
jgi:hypothetical protein